MHTPTIFSYLLVKQIIIQFDFFFQSYKPFEQTNTGKFPDKTEETENGGTINSSNDLQSLHKILLDNYNDNLMHETIQFNRIGEIYWLSVLRIASVLITYSTIEDLKMKQTLRLVEGIMDNYQAGKHNAMKNIKGITKPQEIKQDFAKVTAQEKDKALTNAIGHFWKSMGKSIFKTNAVDELLGNLIYRVVEIPRKRWLETLLNERCDVSLKLVILVLIYILYVCKLQVRVFQSNALVRVYYLIRDENDFSASAHCNANHLPDYMVKVFLFLACIEKPPKLIPYLTSAIDRCADFESIYTDHDILLACWDHYGSDRFKQFLVLRYLTGISGFNQRRRNYFKQFALSNDDLVSTMIRMLVEKPMNEVHLDQIANLVQRKMNKVRSNDIIDQLWNLLSSVLRNYDPLLFNNAKYFAKLCLIKLPTLLVIDDFEQTFCKNVITETPMETDNENMNEMPQNHSDLRTNGTNVHRLIVGNKACDDSFTEHTRNKLIKLAHIADLLAKYIAKIDIKQDNLSLLMQLLTMMFLILKQTKRLNDLTLSNQTKNTTNFANLAKTNENTLKNTTNLANVNSNFHTPDAGRILTLSKVTKILQSNLNYNLPQVLTHTAVMLKDIRALESSQFTALYLNFTNDLIELCSNHNLPVNFQLNYNFLFKQLVNSELIYVEQLLKLFQTLFLGRRNPMLLRTIQRFETDFLRNVAIYEHMYT